MYVPYTYVYREPEERGKGKEERGKRKEERGKRKEERGKKKVLDISEFMTRTHYVYLCIRTDVRIICVCVCVLACEDVWA